MNLTVYKNQYGYSTLAKNKNTGDKMYISVHFTQGTEPNLERAEIKIKDAFFSMYKNKAGFAFPKLVIMKYTIKEQNESPEPEQQNNYFPPVDDNYFPPVEDDSELPF